MRTLLLGRLRLSFGLAKARCNARNCRACLDEFGDHRAACLNAGRIKKRSMPLERILASVCREGGAKVQT
eukprot:3437814-Karenia_brevis.AAC.1